jgi:pyruvate formate lyase activating enzyme
MEIKGIVDVSLVDWDGKVSSVFFLPSCNFRCPFCQNSALVLHPETEKTIPFPRVKELLEKQKGWIDGVCITGGEPTVHNDLVDLCSRLKKMDLLVKLDTNGTAPRMVKELIERRLVDYIALDIKAPLSEEKYSKAIGTNSEILLTKVKSTIEILLKSEIAYEFRTTVVPTLHKRADIEEICRSIEGCRKYVIQRFRGENTIDPAFSELTPFSDDEMEVFVTAARTFLPNVTTR